MKPKIVYYLQPPGLYPGAGPVERVFRVYMEAPGLGPGTCG